MANLTLGQKHTKGKGVGDAVQKKEAAVMAALRENAQKVDEIASQVKAGEYVPQKEIEQPRPSMGTILGNRRKAGIMAVQQATDQARRYARAVPESVLPGSQRTNRYYSMPEVEPEVEERWKQIQGLAGMVHVRENDLNAQQNMLKRHEEELSHNITQLEEIENQYKQNPTQYNADLYNQAYSVYLESYNKYNRAYTLFNADYEDYTPLRSRFDAAAVKYNGLIAYQQKKFEDWRSTIRDEETIQTEMDLIDRQIAAGWQRFFNEPAEYKPGITEGHPEVVIPAEIQELQERRALLDEEYEWSQYYKYRDLMDAEDFAEQSKYVSTANGREPVLNKLSGIYTETGFDDLTYDYINRNEEARNKAMVNSIGDNTAFLGLDNSYLKEMADDEISIFNYLYATQGADAAYQYAAYLTGDLTRRQRQKEERHWRYQATVDPVGSSVFSILMSPMKGLSYLGQLADYTADGQIDQNAAYNKFVYTGNAIRNKVASNWGPVGSFAYQTAMSMGDFLLTTGITGGTNASLLIMGTGAAADTTLAAKDRGLTDAQAFALGTVAGIAEVACERVGLDAMMGSVGLGKDAFGYFLKNVFSEAGEEGLTSAINLVADIVVAGDQSEWQMMVDAYIAQGYTESEAIGMAFGDVAASIGLDMLAGGLSGGFVGVGGIAISSAINYGANQAKYTNAGKAIMGAEGGVDALKQLALEVSGVSTEGMRNDLTNQANNVTGDTVTGKILGKYSPVAAAKNNANANRIGKLYEAVGTAYNAQNQADIAKSLERKGLSSEKANAVAEALLADMNGLELTAEQENLLSDAYDSPAVAAAIKNIVKNELSTMGQRNKTLEAFKDEVNNKIKLKRIIKELDKRLAKEQRKMKAPEEKVSTEYKIGAVSQYETSGDGKITLDGREVELSGLRKLDDGSVVVMTADNQTADAGEVKYSSEGQALVYEAYTNIEATTSNPVIANMDMTSRSALAKAYDPNSGEDARTYIIGSNHSFWYGFEGISMNEKTIPKDSLVRSISKEQRDFAYELGRKASAKAAATQAKGIQSAYNKAVEKLGGKEAAAAVANQKKGKVVLNDGIKESSMTRQQKASYELSKVIAEATGTNIRIYHGVKEYGKYNRTTGEIWLNINAMFTGKSMMAFTLGHELVHMAKQWSPDQFKAFADYLLEQYGKQGVSVEALIQEQIVNAKDNGITLNEHEAYEEVIADACMRMLLDSNAVEKMASFKEKNPSLWQKIVDRIREFIHSIRMAFMGAEPDSLEAKYFKKFDADAKKILENLFVEMVMDAGEHLSTIRNAFGKGTVVEVNADGEFTLAKGEDSNGAKQFLYNDYTWERGGRETLQAALKAEGYSDEDIKAALTIMDGKHDLVKKLGEQLPEQSRINQATITTDLKDGHSVLSALVSNGDYPVNIDLLMVCKKRKAYQRVINRLCETGMIKQATVDALAIAEINKILGKYGFETACLGCFVESRRLRIQEWANTIVKEWNSEVKKRNPNAKPFGFGKGKATLDLDEIMQLVGELESGGAKNDQGNLNLGQGSAVKRMGVLLDKVPSLRKTLSVEDLITPDGLTALRSYDSNLFSMVKSRYGSNSPKFVQEFNPYNHELAMYGKVPSEYKSLREYLYAIGGARMQSFSDFIVENWFDYCQIVADLAARKLPMHTYTKEIALVKLFGLTGIKINMSLIPDIDKSLGKDFAGLTRNEKGELELIWADKDRFKKTGGKSYMQSINFADAIALQNDPRYSANVGTIAIGISDKQIVMMLDDSRIRMIIPYHASGMNPIFADLMGISFYKNYTLYQNTTVKQIYDSKGNPVSLKLDKTQESKLTSGFQFNEELRKLGDARAAAQAYKDWCADASKHTITIKGETYTAELTPKFDSFSWHDNYYKLLEDFNTYDCISEKAAPQGDVQQTYPEDFDSILENELKAQEGHRQRQVANQAFDKAMAEIEAYLGKHTRANTVFYAEQHDIKLSAKDKKLGAEDKRKLADLRKGEKYSMPKVDSDGNNLSAEQIEFFAHSKVRDADGNLLVMYHGTANGGIFTIFDGDKLGNDTRTTQIGQGFYFTNMKAEAESYMKNVDIYGNVGRGAHPHLHKVYLNITNPFDVNADKLDIEKVKAVYGEGSYDYFFDNWIPFYLNRKSVNGRAVTKAEIQGMSKTEKVSAYVDYLSNLGTKEVLCNMVRAFPYGKQSELLAAMKKHLGYDGIVEEFKPGQYQYVAFSSEQIKSVDNQNPTSNPDIRYSMPKSNNPYSYDALVSKPDMIVTIVGENVPKNRADLVRMAKQNAAMVGKIDPKSGSVSVYVKDIDRYVGIGRDGLKHSLDGGRISVNAPVLVKVGEIISNSIRINELTPREDRIDESYVLIGAARNADNDLYIVSSVVNRFSHKLVSMDVLYAINAKKEPAALLPLSAGNPALGTDSTISITKLLDYVNRYFPDVLPVEVLKHYGHISRPNGVLGKDAIYKTPNNRGTSSRELLADAFDELVQTPKERELMDQYRANITKVEEVQDRLQKVRGKIRELTKAKGDKAKIAALNKTAADLADLIDKYDRKLLGLEASKPLRDVLKRAKAAEKLDSDKLMAEYRKQVQERFDSGVEGRRKTEMRHKIQNVVGELNRLLLTNDKKRHVPDNLKKAVADALSLVNMDTVGAEERAAKYADLIAKETDPDKIDAYTVTMENLLRQGEKMGQRLKELRDAYEEIQNSDDPDIANAYDPVIAGSLNELSQSIGNTSLRNMSLAQLRDVYDMYRMVLTRVRDANKSLIDSIKESIAERASKVIGEVRKAGGEHKYRASALDPVKKFSWNNLKPVYAMERIGSSTLTEAYNNVRAGEDTWAKDVVEARKYYLDKSKKYGYDSWDFEKKYTFESTSGVKFELTLEQIMALYAYSKRDQAGDHLRLGGFVFDSNIETHKETVEEKDGKIKRKKSILKYKVNTADAHQISVDILADITGSLTKDQRAFVDEMQDYLSTVMGAKGNEVTMKMYGVKLFKEKFYFPLKSAKQFMFEQNEVSGEVRIKNSGFTNKTKPNANNPIILNNFMDVWANHVNDMSMYHSFVLPLEDFNRIFNYNSPKAEGSASVSVKGTIQNAYDPAAVSYVKQLITDLNGGAVSDPRETVAKSMLAKFKKAKVFSSLSVVIQQPSAIGRAFALINPKYFKPTKDGMNHAALWNELKKYAPVAIIKEMGYFDTNMGKSTQDFITGKEYSSIKEKAKAIFTDGDYRDEVLSKAPALADELAWCAIWNAVKRETVSTHKNLRPGSEAFLKAAGERFTEVITKTQVYDSVLARSANMRSKSGMMSMVTSFMAEPTTSINMIEDALIKAKKGNKRYAARAFASVAVSILLNNALVAIVYAMRDDDEDETFVEKYAQALVSGLLDDANPLTYYPYLKDMWSLFQGYDIERSDMSLVSDLADAAKRLVTAYSTEDGDLATAWWDIAGSVANLGGIPVNNIRRDIKGAINLFDTLAKDMSGRSTTWMSLGDVLGETVRKSLPVVGWLPGDSKADNLYDAIVNGDTAYVDRLKAGYKDENAYNNAVRTAIKGRFLGGDIDYDTAIQNLVEFCGMEEDDAYWKVEEWMYESESDDDFAKYGEFFTAVETGKNLKGVIQKYTDNGVSAETLKTQVTNHYKPLYLEMSNSEKAAIKGYLLNAMTVLGDTREAAESRLKEWEFESKYGFAYNDRRQQFLDGNISASEMRSIIMSVEGKTESEANATIVRYCRDGYEDGYFTRNNAASIMVNYGGLTTAEAEARLRYIDVKKQFPDTYVDDAWVDEYYKEVEASGISIEVFVDYRNQVKGITGEGKKEKRMSIIDSLPITDAQKDALYYAEGWATSRIGEAPWR